MENSNLLNKFRSELVKALAHCKDERGNVEPRLFEVVFGYEADKARVNGLGEESIGAVYMEACNMYLRGYKINAGNEKAIGQLAQVADLLAAKGLDKGQVQSSLMALFGAEPSFEQHRNVTEALKRITF